MSAWVLGVGCAGEPRLPPNQPPTPDTVTRFEPGGNAHDPDRAALERLWREPLGRRRDRKRRFHIRTVDRGSLWRVTKVPLIDLRAAYRYGDDNYAGAGLYLARAEASTSAQACLQQLIADSEAARLAFGVSYRGLEQLDLARTAPDAKYALAAYQFTIKVQKPLSEEEYLAAVMLYRFDDEHCLAQGFAVYRDQHPDLAGKVRARWLRDAAPALSWHAAEE